MSRNDEEKKNFPFEIKSVDPELNLQLLKDFAGERTGFVQTGPQKWFFPSGYINEAEHLYNFEFRKDDVVIITYPRSGTTVMQEMIWLLCNDLNYQKASKIILPLRFPYLEFSMFVHKETKQEFLDENIKNLAKYNVIKAIDYPARKILTNIPGKRFIKTHLPFDLLPPNLTTIGCKIIYVARNPKDVAVSYYHLNRSMRAHLYLGDFRKFWDYFEKDLTSYSPYWEHLKGAWARRHEKNVLFLFYENILQDLKTSIEQVAVFLGKSYTAQDVEKLENHLKFENFKKNKSVNLEQFKDWGIHLKNEASFIRKGKNGGWVEYFDEALNNRADEWIDKSLKNTDLRFPIYISCNL